MVPRDLNKSHSAQQPMSVRLKSAVETGRCSALARTWSVAEKERDLACVNRHTCNLGDPALRHLVIFS